MTLAALLQISDRLAASSDNEAHGPIRHHDLDAVLAFSKRRLMTTDAAVEGRTGLLAVVLDDAPNLVLGVVARLPSPGDSTAAVLPGPFRPRRELHSRAGLGFDPTQILALSSNDETNHRGVNLDCLRIIVAGAGSRRGSLAASSLPVVRGQSGGGGGYEGARGGGNDRMTDTMRVPSESVGMIIGKGRLIRDYQFSARVK